MKTLTNYSLVFLMLSSVAFGAGDGAHHEPSITDLVYPAINFVILVGFLVWKLKAPMQEMFNKKSEDVRSLMNSAAEKNKDAQSRLSELQGKMKNLDAELAKIAADYNGDVASFKNTQANETQMIISRTKKDIENKLEGEQKELSEKINQELIDSVIAKTQAAIKGSSDMKNRATQKIVSELR